MPAHRDEDPRLVDRARRGELTRANTAKGTPERRAVDRATYLRRRSGRSGLSARQALGNPGAGDRRPRIGAFVDDPPRWVELELSRGEVRRAGRYMALVGALAEGRVSPVVFRRRVGSWRLLSNGARFVADPDTVLALVDQRRAADVEVFVYESGRAS